MSTTMDNQTYVALGFEIADLQKMAQTVTREALAGDELLFHAVCTFNALTGGKMLFKADMTPQRRRLIVQLLKSVYALVESSDDAWVRASLCRAAETMTWENEQGSAA